jgi:threonine 3-dehydrogenase
MTNFSDDKTLKMLAVVKEKPENGFSLKEMTISTALRPDEVLVKVYRASFCGTDYHIYVYDNWAKNRLKLPLIVGHEFSGEIIKVGSNVSNVRVGDLVSAETHIICNDCEFCRRGEGHICFDTKVLGLDIDGCFANYVKIPAANCFVNSKEVNQLFLSVQEPLGNAVHTIAHFPVKDKDVVILWSNRLDGNRCCEGLWCS